MPTICSDRHLIFGAVRFGFAGLRWLVWEHAKCQPGKEPYSCVILNLANDLQEVHAGMLAQSGNWQGRIQ